MYLTVPIIISDLSKMRGRSKTMNWGWAYFIGTALAIAADAQTYHICVRQPTIAAIPTSTNITSVPSSFADLPAVQTYFSTAVPIIESRLDTLEAKWNQQLAALKLSNVIASV